LRVGLVGVDLTAEIAGTAAAHERLWVTLEGLSDPMVDQPSLLPGWTVGHVLNHLARNAESHLRLITGALAGVSVDRYSGGDAERDALIEDGARRSAAALVADVRRTASELEAAWGEMTPSSWQVVGRCMGSDEPAHTSPWNRWREVEIHHVDLGLASFGPSDWSREFLRRELHLAEMSWRASHTLGLTALPAAALKLPAHDRLAWLLGRLVVDGLANPG
jgi:maleylpyruvate isomerase